MGAPNQSPSETRSMSISPQLAAVFAVVAASSLTSIPLPVGEPVIARTLLEAIQNSDSIKWIESYSEAIAVARRTGKPIFLEFRCFP